MTITRQLLIGLMTATIGLAGAVEARDRDDSKRGHGDGTRAEQRARGQRVENRRQQRSEHRVRKDGDRPLGSDRIAKRSDRIAERSERFAKRFDARQERQRKRIRKGVRSGELTRGEARRLRSQQRRIADMADRFGDDGRYTRSERRRLARAQKKARRYIAWARNNDRYRHRWHHSHRGREWYGRAAWRHRDD